MIASHTVKRMPLVSILRNTEDKYWSLKSKVVSLGFECTLIVMLTAVFNEVTYSPELVEAAGLENALMA